MLNMMMNKVTINLKELSSFGMGLQEARRMSFRHVVVERQSLCAIRWALGVCMAPWSFVDVVEEIMGLANDKVIYCIHVRRIGEVL